MIEKKLKFWNQNYLVKTDIDEFASYISSELTPYFGDFLEVDMEISVLKEAKLGNPVRFNRPRPGSLIETRGNKITIGYNPGLIAKIRYGFTPMEHPSVLSWITYLGILFPLFSHYEGKGYIPIHGGLVECNGKTVLILGRGGSGKSSLIAMLLADQRTAFGGDNLVLINPGTGYVLPIAMALHLEESNLRRLTHGREVENVERASNGVVRIKPKNVFVEPRQLDKIIVLGESSPLTPGSLIEVMEDEAIIAAYGMWFMKLNKKEAAHLSKDSISGLLRITEQISTLSEMDENRVMQIVNKLKE